MTVKQRYQRERRRIQRYVSDMKRRGYNVDEVSIPKIPKNITEGSVRNLQKYTPQKLRENMYNVNEYTGEIVRATNRVGTKRLRQEIKDTPYLARAVIQNFMDEVYNIGNEHAIEFMEQWLNSWVSRDGYEMVAFSLEAAANNGIRFRVEYSDSYELVKKKSIWFIRKTVALSEEYSEETINELEEQLQSDW